MDSPLGRAMEIPAGERGPVDAEEASDSEDSSDTEDFEHKGNYRQRLLERRGKHRVRQIIRDYETTGPNSLGVSTLEMRSVSAKTREKYRQSVREFLTWSGLSEADLKGDDNVDQQLVAYMNFRFAQGHKAWVGEKLLSALMFFSPKYGRHGSWRIPRALRCAKGWQKASPSRSRRPLVYAIWTAIAAEMCRLGSMLSAVLTLVMVDCYLRPGEMLGLTPASFLEPSAHAVQNWVILLFPQEKVARSKVGDSDDTIPLDSARSLWMAPVFAALCRHRPASSRLLNMSYLQYLTLFRTAVGNLGLDVVPYQGRHSGASLDRGEGRRSLEAVQKRGRWASQRSVRRYEKAGLLNQSWSKLSVEVKAHCDECLRSISDIVLHGKASPRPPFVGCSAP